MLTFSETGEFNTLEAVNLALTYMREPRIDDLALINTSFAAEMAYAGLLQQNRMLQTRGWWFNSPTVTLSPETTGPNAGKIVIPASYAKVSINRADRSTYGDRFGVDVHIADDMTRFLLNVSTDSLIWPNAVVLDVLRIKKFEQTPDAFRQYVALMNASLCGQQVDEGISLSPFHQRVLDTALAEVMEQDLTNDRVNNFSNIPQVR